jgi:hypothetical protein
MRSTKQTQIENQHTYAGPMIPDEIIKKNQSLEICPKIIFEHNLDVHKAQQKGVSLIKFMSAKKKYIRNLDQQIQKNEPDLKKEHYIHL